MHSCIPNDKKFKAVKISIENFPDWIMAIKIITMFLPSQYFCPNTKLLHDKLYPHLRTKDSAMGLVYTSSYTNIFMNMKYFYELLLRNWIYVKNNNLYTEIYRKKLISKCCWIFIQNIHIIKCNTFYSHTLRVKIIGSTAEKFA